MHNILICQDILNQYKRKSQPARCTLKVDIRKAYDFVSWKFLENLLKKLQFHAQFCNWIMKCVSSPSFSISFNGGLFWFFKGKKG